MSGYLSLGPFDDGLRGPLLLEMEIGGGRITEASIGKGLGARGLEGAFENIDPSSAALVAAHACERSGVAHAIAFCQAVEDATGHEVEAGQAAARVVLAEMERIAAHLGCVSAVGRALGDDVVYRGPRRYLARIRQTTEEMTGNRFGFGSVVPGGVKIAGDAGALEGIEQVGEALVRDTRFWDRKLTMSRRRLRGAHLPNEWLPDDQPPAPAFRASGLARDSRSGEDAYGYYRELDYEPASRSEGRAADRVLLLLDEVRRSYGLISRARKEAVFEGGPGIDTHFGKASGTGFAESPEGAVEYRVFLGSENRVMRCRVSCAVEGVAEYVGRAMRGVAWEDALIAFASFILCQACIDL